MRTILWLLTACFFLTSTLAAETYKGYGAESVTLAEIKTFAPPTLEKDISKKIQRYLDLKAPSEGIVSNDGKLFVFSWSISGVKQIWISKGSNTFPRQLTGGEDVTSPVAITADNKKVVLQRDEGGKEAPGIYLISVDGGSLETVYQKEKVVAQVNFLTPDGKYLFYSANDIQPDAYALYRYEFSSKKTEKILDQKGLWQVVDASKDNRLLLELSKGNFAQEIFELNLKTKKLTPLLGQDEMIPYEVAYAPGEKSLFVSTDKFGEFFRLYQYDYLAAKPKFTPVSEDISSDIERFAIDSQRRYLYYNTNEGGYTKLYVKDPITYRKLSAPTFENAEQVKLGSFSLNGKTLTLSVGRFDTPNSSYVYNNDTRQVKQWVFPSTPELNTKSFSKATLEFYPAKDGTKIPMFVRRPAQCVNKLCPVLVNFHGGPEGQSLPGFNLGSQIFVDQGFIFVDPNVRGSTGYGKAWRDSDNGKKRLDVVSDIKDCADFIRGNWKQNGVKPKIGVMGGSYGGYSVLLAMTLYSGSYDAGVSNVGISNFMTFLMNTAPYRRLLRVAEYGDPEKDKEALIALSPSTHIDKISSPLMIIQGVNDPRVPAGEAVQMYKALELKKIPASLILFEDEGHGAAKRSNQVLQLGHTLQFFQRHLVQ